MSWKGKWGIATRRSIIEASSFKYSTNRGNHKNAFLLKWNLSWIKFQLAQYFLILHSDVHKQSYWKNVSSHLQFQKDLSVRSIYCNWKKVRVQSTTMNASYIWLPITRTRKFEPRANSNQNWFPLDFRHTFTVILPSITRTFR